MSLSSVEKNEEITISQLVKIIYSWLVYLKKYWLQILGVGIIGILFGVIYVFYSKPTYTASLTFVLEEGKSNSPNVGGLATIAGQFGVDIGGLSGGGLLSGENILLYFRSPSLAREVLLTKFDSVSNETIADVYAHVYEYDKLWARDKNIGKIKFDQNIKDKNASRLYDSLLSELVDDILTDNFSVNKVDKKSGFINVSTTMISEQLAKVYCEKVVQSVVDRYISIKTHRQKVTVDKLQARVDSISNLLKAKTILSSSVQTSANVMDVNPIYKTETSVIVETSNREKSLLATIYATVTQNLEMAKFSLSQETPVIQIVDNPRYPLKKSEKSLLITSALSFIAFSFSAIVFFILKKILT